MGHRRHRVRHARHAWCTRFWPLAEALLQVTALAVCLDWLVHGGGTHWRGYVVLTRLLRRIQRWLVRTLTQREEHPQAAWTRERWRWMPVPVQHR